MTWKVCEMTADIKREREKNTKWRVRESSLRIRVLEIVYLCEFLNKCVPRDWSHLPPSQLVVTLHNEREDQRNEIELNRTSVIVQR